MGMLMGAVQVATSRVRPGWMCTCAGDCGRRSRCGEKLGDRCGACDRLSRAVVNKNVHPTNDNRHTVCVVEPSARRVPQGVALCTSSRRAAGRSDNFGTLDKETVGARVSDVRETSFQG